MCECALLVQIAYEEYNVYTYIHMYIWHRSTCTCMYMYIQSVHTYTVYVHVHVRSILQVEKSFTNMDVGMHHAKNHGNKDISLAILSRILAQSCVTLCLNYVGRVTHDCAGILDSIVKGISLFPRFFAWCIPTSIFIQLNDFSTCSTYFSGFAYKCSYAHVYMRSAAPLSRVSLVKWRRSSSHTLGS